MDRKSLINPHGKGTAGSLNHSAAGKAGTGIPKHRYTHEEKLILAKKVCNLYATGKYTLEFCCKYNKLKHSTFRKWVRPEADIEAMILANMELPQGFIMEIREMFMEAKTSNKFVFMDDIRDKARVALGRRVEGFASQEVVEEEELDTRLKDEETGEDNPNFGKMRVIKRKTKTYDTAPDTTAIIFTLVNTDPDNFKHRNTIDHTVKADIHSTGLESMSEEGLALKEKELSLHVETLRRARESKTAKR